MEKSEDALRTIGEVSEALSVKPHILRYWEEQFSTLNPLKRAGGRRYYRSEDMALLRRINRLLNEEGYTIKGAQKALKQPEGQGADISASPTEPVSQSPEPLLPFSEQSSVSESMLIELRAIRSELVEALEAAR
ncbi:MerR family transcriptional regulator [Alterisphingorhabdus coralli]|uniref:MerR family transcriptional regulator n=1 Tax=Alterisphingorhabdus coralli TaxID=3071408 RepID=A0AA97F740_9SPHN|nr:MerR family transcriptional regulator [Parasphingorhabdus sp. SCSIO 66989]WOE74706.1 MerR family transcriptional regulator [Parasphingorhabdus sp. SCSIO 66989]